MTLEVMSVNRHLVALVIVTLNIQIHSACNPHVEVTVTENAPLNYI